MGFSCFYAYTATKWLHNKKKQKAEGYNADGL